ncbi:MAG TPA: BREX system ATP-binding domain-containing protein [Streptosporangiaceae bacterium]|nr:BREX system ATP-binding domain-containing protein [Streptosporangiaceae bacterium]
MQQDACGPMVGRGRELARLLALLDSVAAGEAAVALVSGDAGVGKTRLVTELSLRAREHGFIVLAGRCAELGDSVPYLPLADALRSVTGEAVATVAALVADRPVLGRLLPDHGPGIEEHGDGRELARQQLFGAVLGLLSELAETSPVLLVLEDLHWADRSTRDLVTFLSRMLHRERVAVLGTYRTDDLHRRHPLRPVVAELLRLPNVTPIELGPLEPAALAEHIMEMAQLSRRRTPEASELITIVDRAEGNAYYAEELLAASDGSEDLPAGLAALLMTRVEQLSATAQQALRAAAAAGRRVDDELVMAASGLSAPEYEAAIREAVAHQLLVGDGQGGFTFRHALLREAIYADLLPGERTRLHATLAGLLADEERLDTVPGTAAELAHHALASHDIAGAFAASVRAGQEAERLAAPAEAHRHYDQALALWDRVDEPEKKAGMNRAKLALKSATNAAASGDLQRAVHQLRRVSAVLTDDYEPALVSRIRERLAYYFFALEVWDEAAEAARAAIDAIPGDPPTWERARAMGTYANVLLAIDDEQASEQAERAIEAARAAGAPWVEADALVTLGQVSERSGCEEEMLEQFASAHKQAREAGVLGVELRAAYHLARVRLERGDLTEASIIAHQGFSRAEEAGLARAPYGTDLQYLHYLAHYGDGDWDHAQELADGFSVRVASQPEAELSAMALFIDVARGHDAVIAERRRWLEPLWPSSEFAEYTARGLLAEHALWRGDAETALAEIGAALQAEADTDEFYGPSVIRLAAIGLCARAGRASLARATGDTGAERAEIEAASELIEAARLGARHLRRPKAVLGLEGRAWLARAEAEWSRVTGENSPEVWESVLAAFDHGFVYEAARARWRLAEALAEAGRRDEAQREWDRAAEVAGHLGAVPLRSALDDLARRARLGHGPAPGWAGGRPGRLAGLTSREREVLRLIVAGRSNREIGATLFIAPKTASVHVSNILAKLGAASRTEAAAIAHDEGLTAEPALPAR